MEERSVVVGSTPHSGFVCLGRAPATVLSLAHCAPQDHTITGTPGGGRGVRGGGGGGVRGGRGEVGEEEEEEEEE